ncbi:MAG: S-methyl-5-thioribose-1-phosphate isomerase [Gemmatimonadaceae bacterium]
MEVICAVRWSDDGRNISIVDQRELPGREVRLELGTVDAVYDAIRTLAVRGAPAIGVTAAMALSLAVDETERDRESALSHVIRAAGRLKSARPTAVNLAWAIDRVIGVALRVKDASQLRAAIRDEATHILDEDRAMCRGIGEAGAELISDGARILTHCNTGALATAGIGTALAAIYVAAEQGKRVQVYAGETRPLLQGARLTAWELQRAGIPVCVLVDSAAASLMADGEIDMVLVGADRIATNGDAANKIGTYSLAVAAHHHGIPFYIAAPSSTFDPTTRNANGILIEQRAPDEVRRGFGVATTPPDVSVHNPAFDVTPGSLVSALVSEHGVHRPPYDFSRGVR